MEPHGTRRPSTGQPPPSDHRLSHRISNFSDIADYQTYDAYQSEAQSPQSPQQLRGRDSLVSLQSAYDTPSYTSNYNVSRSNSSASGWSNPFLPYSGGSGGGYEPVPVSGGPTHQRSRAFSRMTSQGTLHATIAEEPENTRDSIDLATLVSHAAPMGSSGAYSSLPKDDDVEEGGALFDPTGFMGPTTSQDEAFMKKLQEQEASGKLTGGLGTGFKSGTTMKESELLATSPVVDRSLSRSFTRSRSQIGRHGTVKALGQDAANKRGEIVEVIIEESGAMQSEVDLSSVVGPTPASDSTGMRHLTLPMKKQRTEVFYPQPDWKPFSMRWPYLLFLIVLSIALGGTQEVIYQMSAHHPLLTFKSPSDIPPLQYFAFKYVPTLITVTYGVLWQITDFEVRRLEAFYQLSKEGGALAAESINVDYVTHFSFLRPFHALYCKHYAVALSSVTSLLAISLVPTLGAASIVLNPDRAARIADPSQDKTITISPVWSRFLSVILFIIAFLGCILFWQLQSRKSGLLSDVKGIAGLASMAVVSHILTDFKDMDVATHEDIHKKLKHHRYVLRNSSLAPDEQNPVTRQEQDRYKENHLSQNPHPLMLRPLGNISFIVGIILFLLLIPIFLFTPANALTDKAAWVVTLLAVGIKMTWGALETSVRMMEPYYILSRRHAPPKTLTLDYTAMPFGWVAVKALFNGHLLIFLVGFGTIMTEFLTVLVTSLATVEGRDFLDVLNHSHSRPGKPGDKEPDPNDHEINSGQETEHSFWISLGLAVFILLYMGIVALTVFIRRRRPFLPRQPNTIASVLAFIHQSRMVYDFVGTSKDSSAKLTRKLESLKKTYGLGWFEGRDGQTHCGVDQEELMSNYKLGYDYSRSNKPWVEQNVDWL